MEHSGLTLDFFHDVVCGWCFNLSPRLHVLAGEFDLDIRHRTFVLQDSPAGIVARFGSMPRAKETILGHWVACREASDAPLTFNVEGMRRTRFDYPHGLPAALAGKAVQRLAGQDGHWRMFDAIQRAHISEARNVADQGVLAEIAEEIGFNRMDFENAASDPDTRLMVEHDRTLARRLQVSSVPTVIIRETGTRLVNGPLDDLRAQIAASWRLVA